MAARLNPSNAPALRFENQSATYTFSSRPNLPMRSFLITACVLGVLVFSTISASGRSLTVEPIHLTTDFVEYWAAARLILAGDNPYSPEKMLHLQRSVGWKKDSPLLMWNPPWVLFFLLPFGFFNYQTGLLAWLMFQTFIILFCARRLWHLYGGAPKHYRIAWLISLSFLPTLFVLALGQIGPMVLLGVVAFLHFQEMNRWRYAAAALILILVKPHLIYLFWLALALWIWSKRRWHFLCWMVVLLISATLIPFILNPSIFAHYLELYQLSNVTRPFDWETPTMGRALRALLGDKHLFLQLLPSMFASFWFFLYWKRHQTDWDWAEEMPLLLLVSLSTTFFSWTFDLVVLLPAVLQAAIWLQSSPRTLRWLTLICYLAVNLLTATLLLMAMAQEHIITNDFWSFWIAPVFLFTYLSLRHRFAFSKLNRTGGTTLCRKA